jgi:hypothetical protein
MSLLLPGAMVQMQHARVPLPAANRSMGRLPGYRPL